MVKKDFIAALICMLVFALLPASFPAFTAVQFQSPVQAGQWVPVIHAVHNAYFLWRPDVIFQLFQGMGSAGLPIRLELFLMALGFYLLFARARSEDCLAPFAAALLAPLVLGLWFGQDVSVIPPMSVFPWAVLAAKKLRARTSILSVLLMLLAGVWLAESAQNLALFYVLAVVCTFRALPDEQQAAATDARGTILLWVCLLAPALVQLWLMPVLPFPDYPILARVVPDDGIRGIVRPLLGPDTEIPSIDRGALKQALWPLVAGLICFWLLLIASTRGKAPRSPLAIMVSVLIFSAAFDILPLENLAVIGPAAALSRMLPKLFLVPLVPALAALSFALALIFAAKEQQLPRALAFVAVLLGVQALCCSSHSLRTFGEDDFRPFRTVSAFAENGGTQLLETLLSPSYAVAKEVGTVMFFDRAGYEALHFKTPSAGQTKIRAWPDSNDAALPFMTDRDLQTRWSTKRGEQTGDEWIEVFFDSPRRISGIEINSGKYLADFGRGLRLSYVSNCEPPSGKGPEKPPLGWIPAGDFPSWQGEIKYTPQGYPYYGSQSVFRQYFPKPVEVQCFLIEQTGKFESFEWSVAEIRVARAGSDGRQD